MKGRTILFALADNGVDRLGQGVAESGHLGQFLFVHAAPDLIGRRAASLEQLDIGFQKFIEIGFSALLLKIDSSFGRLGED